MPKTKKLSQTATSDVAEATKQKATKSTKKKKDKKIKFHIFALYEATNQSTPLTFVHSKDAAVYTIGWLIYLKHREHYELWSKLRSLSPIGFGTDSYVQYLNTCVDNTDPSEQFTIQDISYTLEDLASFMRMFSLTVPIGLPYEFYSEIKFFTEQRIPSNPTSIYDESFRQLVKEDPSIFPEHFIMHNSTEDYEDVPPLHPEDSSEA